MTNMGLYGKHLGVDYATAIGTPVFAPCEGTILGTPYSSAVGQQIHLTEAGNGRIHRLLHLNSEHVSVGQRVAEGQLIAMTGNTGITTGPHLHWDVRRANTAWDASFANFYDPETLFAPSVKPGLQPGKTVFLKPHVSSWRFYPPTVQPKVGREIGYLNPKRYGGLTYTVLAVPFTNTATIQTMMFGRVNIYIDSDAEIR